MVPHRVHLGGDVYQNAMELNGRGELIPAYWQAGPQGVFTNIKLPARELHWGTE